MAIIEVCFGSIGIMTLGPLTPLLPSFHAVRLVCAANDVFRIQKLDEKSLHAAVLGKKKTCIYIKPVLSTPSKENLPSLVTACFSISVPYEVACLSQNRGLRLCRKPTICVRKRFNRDCTLEDIPFQMPSNNSRKEVTAVLISYF